MTSRCRSMSRRLSAASVVVVGALAISAQPAKTAVVVELFTSEGCSSCPPADAVLSRLETAGTVGGALVIPLGLHVTYWDQLGWKDPASLADATDRQQEYGRGVFGVDNVYTPQAVVDGRVQLVGSDERALRSAIAKAASEPHIPVRLTVSMQADVIVAHVDADPLPSQAHESVQNVFFITEDGLTSIVKRGENGGRTLHNDAVLNGTTTTEKIGRLTPGWRRDHLHLVVVVQGT